MAITNYERPHLEVHQLMAQEVVPASDHRSACVVGANYALYRYGHEDLEAVDFAPGTEIPYAFEQRPGYEYEVDPASVEVTVENLEASLATFTSGIQPDAKNLLGIRLTGGKLLSANTVAGLENLHGDLEGLPVMVGDIVRVTAAGGVRVCTVTGLLGKKVAASATVSADTGSAFATAAVVDEDAYTGTKDTSYVVEVTAVADKASKWADVTFRVADTTGVDTASSVPGAATIAVGTKGVQVTLPTTFAAPAVGAKFSVICLAERESATEFDGVELSAMPVGVAERGTANVITTAEFCKPFSGTISSVDVAGATWIASDSGVTILEGLSMYIPEREVPYVDFVAGRGKVYVGYRVLMIPQNKDEDVVLVNSTEDIQNVFGTIAPGNDIAYGCYCALRGSEGRGVYAVRTAGTDADAFYAAVKKTGSTAETYSFAILTDDVEVMDRVVEFNLAQSTPEVMRWRRTLVGAEAPGEYLAAARDAANRPLKAVVAANTDGKNTLVQIFTENTDFSFRNIAVSGGQVAVRAGDKIEIMASGKKYTIAYVLSDTEVILETGPDTAISPATQIAIWKADTEANAAEYVTNLAKHFNNRRVVVVWSDRGTDDGVVISNKFLAAEVAGLCSRVEPQQGITKFDILTVDAAPRMYTRHTTATLDAIAKEGVMIVTQNVRGGAVHIRHQLTTETDKGILYYEDSCTRNLDNISYGVADVLDRYIGKANVVRSALQAIELDVRGVLNTFTSNATSDLVGPSLVSWENLTVQQDPTFKDRVIINVTLYLPAPLNVIEVYEAAFIADLTLTA